VTVVLGFDTSLTVTGCARVEVGVGASGQVEALDWCWWRARAGKPEQDTVESRRRRQRVMLREILALCPDVHDLAVVEGPAMGAKHAALADERAGLRWMLIDQLLARGPVVLVSPSTRALLGGGSGRARKPAVHAGVRRVFPAAEIPVSGEGRFDVADAVVLAAMGAHAVGMPWPVGLAADQRTAFAKVAWPVSAAA